MGVDRRAVTQTDTFSVRPKYNVIQLIITLHRSEVQGMMLMDQIKTGCVLRYLAC